MCERGRTGYVVGVRVGVDHVGKGKTFAAEQTQLVMQMIEHGVDENDLARARLSKEIGEARVGVKLRADHCTWYIV